LLGIGIFAFFSTGSGNKSGPRLVIWGSLDARMMDTLVSQMKSKHGVEFNFDYIQKDQTTFDQSLVEALAVGNGPDLILLPQDEIIRNQDKLFVIPLSSLSKRTFLDAYIDEGGLYMASNGTLGIPFAVDPLVMYWNKNLITGAGFTKPASNWNELFTQISALTSKNSSFNITTSAIAMGEWSNVRYSKEILSALIMQAGNPIVVRVSGGDQSLDTYKSVLSNNENQTVPPASDALGFFTEFSNPSKDTYSWNRSLRDSQSAFLAGNLAYYLGFASEVRLLQVKNPNLSYDMALFPQPLDAQKRTTFGKMQAIAILKRSPNIAAAFALVSALTSAQTVAEFSSISGLAPARRDLLAIPPNDQYSPIVYNSALFASGWLDPDRIKTGDIFKQMANYVTTGSLRPSEAVTRAGQELDLLFNVK
jgi:ABC-type glycerol-3-phosphate transport system substrate-binding protein